MDNSIFFGGVEVVENADGPDLFFKDNKVEWTLTTLAEFVNEMSCCYGWEAAINNDMRRDLLSEFEDMLDVVVLDDGHFLSTGEVEQIKEALTKVLVK